MMMAKMLIMATVMVAASAATAQETTPNPTPATPPAAAEKKVCRSEQVTGSMMPKRICHLRSEWAAIDQANADAVQNMRNRNGNSAQH